MVSSTTGAGGFSAYFTGFSYYFREKSLLKIFSIVAGYDGVLDSRGVSAIAEG